MSMYEPSSSHYFNNFTYKTELLDNFTKLKRSEKGEVTWSEYLSVSFLILLLGYEIWAI